MPTIENGSLILCLQALEKAIEYNEYLAQFETVDKDDYEEINYQYELALNKLAKVYNDERAANSNLLPIEKLVKYRFGS